MLVEVVDNLTGAHTDSERMELLTLHITGEFHLVIHAKPGCIAVDIVQNHVESVVPPRIAGDSCPSLV